MSWPTTDDPRTEFVTLRFTVGEAGALDTYAQTRGISRSAAVRDAVERVMKAEDRRAKKTRAAGNKRGAGMDGEDHEEAS